MYYVHLVWFWITLLFATYKLLFVEKEDNVTKQGQESEYSSGWRPLSWDMRFMHFGKQGSKGFLYPGLSPDGSRWVQVIQALPEDSRGRMGVPP